MTLSVNEMMSEREWQDRIIYELIMHGWRWYHMGDSRTVSRGPKGLPVTRFGSATGKGYPDLFAVRRNRAIAIEVKSQKGRVSREQRDWLADLAATGIETYVWRPADLATMLSVLE